MLCSEIIGLDWIGLVWFGLATILTPIEQVGNRPKFTSSHQTHHKACNPHTVRPRVSRSQCHTGLETLRLRHSRTRLCIFRGISVTVVLLHTLFTYCSSQVELIISVPSRSSLELLVSSAVSDAWSSTSSSAAGSLCCACIEHQFHLCEPTSCHHQLDWRVSVGC